MPDRLGAGLRSTARPPLARALPAFLCLVGSFIGFGWRQRIKTRVLSHWALIGFASRPMPPAPFAPTTMRGRDLRAEQNERFDQGLTVLRRHQAVCVLFFRAFTSALPRCRLFDKPPLPPQGGRLGGLSSVGGGFLFPPPPPEGDGGRRNAPPPSPRVCGVCRRQGFGAVSPSLRALDCDDDPADPGRLFHPPTRKSLSQLRSNGSTILSTV